MKNKNIECPAGLVTKLFVDLKLLMIKYLGKIELEKKFPS